MQPNSESKASATLFLSTLDLSAVEGINEDPHREGTFPNREERLALVTADALRIYADLLEDRLAHDNTADAYSAVRENLLRGICSNEILSSSPFMGLPPLLEVVVAEGLERLFRILFRSLETQCTDGHNHEPCLRIRRRGQGSLV